MAPISMTLSDL